MIKAKSLASRRSLGRVRSEASRLAILSAAKSVLDEMGADALTIERVAKEARASKPTIYKWWGDKQALLAEVYCVGSPVSTRDEPSQKGVREKLLGFYNSLWEIWSHKANAETTRWLFKSALSSDAATLAYKSEYYAARCKPVLRILEQAKSSGEIACDAELFLDMIVGFHMLRVLLDKPVGQDEIQRSVDILLYGAIQAGVGAA